MHDRSPEEKPDFESFLLRPNKEVACFFRKHDRLVRCVYPLLSKFTRGFAQALPCIHEVFGEISRQICFCRRPTIVLFLVFNPLMAVVTLLSGHTVMIPTGIQSGLSKAVKSKLICFIAIVIHSAVAWGAPPLQETPRQPTGVIAGRVVDDDGRPMRGVQVQAFAASHRHGRRDMEPRGNVAATNDRGEFRLFWLEPAAYYVIANPNPLPDLSRPQTASPPVRYLPSDPDVTFVMTYLPGTWEVSRAEVVQVGRGEVSVGAIQMAALPTRVIRLSVANAKVFEGTSFGVLATLRSERDPSMVPIFASAPRQTARNEFEARIGLMPGLYEVIVSVLTTNGTQIGSRTFSVDRTDLEPLIVPVSPTKSVEGQVVAEGNQASLRVIAAPTPSPLIGVPAWTSVRSNGRFMLEVLPGTYALTVEGLQHDDYLAEAEFQGKPVSPSLIEFLPDAESLSLKLSIKKDGGSVGGVVMDANQPQAGAIVVLAPAEDSGALGQSMRFTVTNPQGEFEIRGIVPGQYVAVAFDDSQWERLRDPAFVKSLAADGAAFTVTSGNRHNLSLIRIPK